MLSAKVEPKYFLVGNFYIQGEAEASFLRDKNSWRKYFALQKLYSHDVPFTDGSQAGCPSSLLPPTMAHPFFKEKILLKRKIIKTCIAHKICARHELDQVRKQLVIDLANLPELDALNRPGPAREELLEQLINSSVQLNALTQEIKLLRTFWHEKLYQQIQLGAVVKTDRLNYLVGVNHPPFKVCDESYTGISTQSPFLWLAQGLVSGDSFTVAGQTHLICEVF